MEGPVPFHRAQRAQANQVEQMPIFFALMWSAAVLVNGPLSGAIGLVWVALRISYALNYRKVAKRSILLLRTLPAYVCLFLYVLALVYGALTALCAQAGLDESVALAGLGAFSVLIFGVGTLHAKAVLAGALDDEDKAAAADSKPKAKSK
jgi:uncharacterized MAPEG superfamily protein